MIYNAMFSDLTPYLCKIFHLEEASGSDVRAEQISTVGYTDEEYFSTSLRPLQALQTPSSCERCGGRGRVVFEAEASGGK